MPGRVKLSVKEKQIAVLLLQGYESDDIQKELHIAKRTLKAHLNRMFIRFGILDGIKRVKLVMILYRNQAALCLTDQAPQDKVSTEVENLVQKNTRL